MQRKQSRKWSRKIIEKREVILGKSKSKNSFSIAPDLCFSQQNGVFFTALFSLNISLCTGERSAELKKDHSMCDRNDFKSYDGVRVVGTEKNGNESENSSRVDKNSKIKKVWESQNIIKSKACVFHSY